MIAKSIGQAFNVAYQEFLRQNGLSDEVVEEAEYNGVLEAQKILGEDLSLLADENSSKEVSSVEMLFIPCGTVIESMKFMSVCRYICGTEGWRYSLSFHSVDEVLNCEHPTKRYSQDLLFLMLRTC